MTMNPGPLRTLGFESLIRWEATSQQWWKFRVLFRSWSWITPMNQSTKPENTFPLSRAGTTWEQNCSDSSATIPISILKMCISTLSCSSQWLPTLPTSSHTSPPSNREALSLLMEGSAKPTFISFTSNSTTSSFKSTRTSSKNHLTNIKRLSRIKYSVNF